MDSLRSLGVKGSYDEAAGAVKLYLPQDLPFSAASLQGTMRAIEHLADNGRVSAEFAPRTGMVISVPFSGPNVRECSDELFATEAPLQATPTERDLNTIDLLCVDIDDCTVMVDPAQVLTVLQLKQFLRRLPSAEDYCMLRGDYLAAMWRLTLKDEGYLALGTTYARAPALTSSALAGILRPKYGARGVKRVELVMLCVDPDELNSQATAIVRIHIWGELFETVFDEMTDRLRDNLPPGFSHVTLGRPGMFLQMKYSGDACAIEHPQNLGRTMHELLRPVFRTISAFPAGGSSIEIYYPNPEGYAPTTSVQTSATHYIPVVSDR